MNDTRRVYYNQFIEDNSTDQRRPFAASKSLLNMKKDLSLPHILFHFLQTIWVSFLLPGLPISGQSWTEFLLSTPESNLESESGNIVFSHFQCQAWLRQFVMWLHLERTNLASSCLDSLLPVITNMVNLSLQTGYFAKTCTPSLKKPRLDLLFKNFRLISNLQFVSKLTERVVASQISDSPCILDILLKPGKPLWYIHH